MDRRGFLKAILAAGVAPAIVSAANIMPVRSILMLDDLEEWKRTILAKATGLPTNPVERMGTNTKMESWSARIAFEWLFKTPPRSN